MRPITRKYFRIPADDTNNVGRVFCQLWGNSTDVWSYWPTSQVNHDVWTTADLERLQAYPITREVAEQHCAWLKRNLDF